MKGYYGNLIRRERLRQNKGQKEICYGICVPSYLCKIEKNQITPNEGITKKLLQRLGIELEDDRAFIQKYSALVEEIYDKLKQFLPTDDCYKELSTVNSRLLNSELALDCMILDCFHEALEPKELEPFVETMNDRQLSYYYCVKGYQSSQKEALKWFEKADGYLHTAHSLCQVMSGNYLVGNYEQVQKLENKCVALALEEGNVGALIECNYLVASIYACLNIDKMMMTYYNRALNLSRNTALEKYYAPGIYYNIGSVYISLEQYEKAIFYLEKAEKDNFFTNQKLALTYIRKGQKEEAEPYLYKMEEEIKKKNLTEQTCEYWMLKEARQELRDDFLQDSGTIPLMEGLLEILQREYHFGFLYFYKDIIQKAYCAQRQYKKAYELERKISCIENKIMI